MKKLEVNVWRKASASDSGGNCVEVMETEDGGIAVRDSKDQTGPVLQFNRAEWAAFLDGAKNAEFEI